MQFLRPGEISFYALILVEFLEPYELSSYCRQKRM